MKFRKWPLWGLFFILIILSGCRWPRRSEPSPSSVPLLNLTPTPVQSKPRVLIFSCTGGGGHMSAASAVTAYLGGDYDVHTVNVISEASGNFDLFRVLSLNTFRGEDIYNFFLRNGMSRTVGLYCSLGHMMTSLCSHYLDDRIGEFLDNCRPDIVISVMPFFNGSIQRATVIRHIPFAVITCDLNTVNYVQDLYVSAPNTLFLYGLPFSDPAIKAAVGSVHMPPENIRTIGFPIRPSFFVRHDKNLLKKQFGFPSDVPIVMILMGAAGSRAVLGYLRKLVKMKTKMHILVCVGRNEGLKYSIEKIILPSHITLSIFGYTDKISELMQASDLFITKPGPTSICEALYLSIPLLLDGTSKPMFWETMNIDFVTSHGFGEVVTSLRYVPLQVKKMLEDEGYRNDIIHAMEQFDKPDVCSNVRKLVADLLDQSAHDAYIAKPVQPVVQ